MRQRLVGMLRPLDAVSIENSVGPGTPDINYIGGWIECKWLRSWPKRAETLVRLDHELMPSQKVWLQRRCSRGGVVWVMLQCRREWLLLESLTAVQLLGKATRKELCAAAYHHWNDGLNANELIELLNDSKL